MTIDYQIPDIVQVCKDQLKVPFIKKLDQIIGALLRIMESIILCM